MSEEIKHNRRRFLGTAAMTIQADGRGVPLAITIDPVNSTEGVAEVTLKMPQFGMFRSVEAQSRKAEPADVPPIKPGTNTSFGSLKQIDASVLNIGYAEAGPTDGPVVLLLHGWPYDIHSYVDVAPLLASAGYRVIVPYLRSYGTTRFLSSETVRNGQQSVVALDIIALMDALKIEKATIAGFDWGARTPTSSRRSGRSVARRWSP
jgi:hypothetical protein